LYRRNWIEKEFKTQMVVDQNTIDTPTHRVDCFRNRVALEIEWNNKDPFYDRDLNNFRLLFDLRAISVGVIITRCDDLQDIFNDLGRGSSYGASTTHMSKLLPRIKGGSGAGCPLLVLGISKSLYVEDE
ncbi:MAG: BglII/BstYI family type II restriction endonuclease, partial [Nitrosomonas ureae]